MTDTTDQNPDDLHVEVWDYEAQLFIPDVIRCPGERRVRVDYHGDLSNLGVFDGLKDGNFFIPRDPQRPLNWRMDYS